LKPVYEEINRARKASRHPERYPVIYFFIDSPLRNTPNAEKMPKIRRVEIIEIPRAEELNILTISWNPFHPPFPPKEGVLTV